MASCDRNLHQQPEQMPVAVVLGALAVYRIIYYLLPFMAAAVLLAGREIRQKVF